jgi:hypothetical protein
VAIYSRKQFVIDSLHKKFPEFFLEKDTIFSRKFTDQIASAVLSLCRTWSKLAGEAQAFGIAGDEKIPREKESRCS